MVEVSHNWMMLFRSTKEVVELTHSWTMLFRSTKEVVERAAVRLDPRSESPMKPESDAVEPSENARCIPSPSSSSYGEFVYGDTTLVICGH